MGKKMFSITLALILFTANVIPTFAIEEQTGEPSTDIVQEEYLEQQEENNNNDAVKNIESNKEKPVRMMISLLWMIKSLSVF